MASITLQYGHKNLLFAASVANETGAQFEENSDWITISDSPLEIPRYVFNDIFDPTGDADSVWLEQVWRSLLLNKKGHLVLADDSEIVIADEKPRQERPTFLLRFPDEQAKREAESWASRLGYTLTDYVLQSVEEANDRWERQEQEALPA